MHLSLILLFLNTFYQKHILSKYCKFFTLRLKVDLALCTLPWGDLPQMLHSKWSSQKHVKFKVKSVLIAGTYSHISAFPVSAKTMRYSNFPKRVSAGMKCSKCLKCPERRDAVCCQHL